MTRALHGVGGSAGGAVRLAGIDLALEAGSLTVLLGLARSGKTALMRVMAGLDRPDAGRVLADGVDVTGRPARDRGVAMVYRQFINYPSMTVYDNIAAPLRRRRVAAPDIERRVRETARLMRLGGVLDRRPAALSGDQQQRTAIARALVRDADPLFLDEPLANLDRGPRDVLRGELRDIFRQSGAAVVYATAEPREALLLGGVTVVMDQGRVLQTGPTLDVYHAPASTRVGQIFSDPPMNLIYGVVADGEALLGRGVRLPLAGHLCNLAPAPYCFGARANHLSVTRRTRGDVPFAATVELAEINGSETLVHVNHDGVSWVVRQDGVHRPTPGEAIGVFLDPRRLFAFDGDGRLAAAPDMGLDGGGMA